MKKKMFFFKNLEFLLNGRNKVINAFQSNILYYTIEKLHNSNKQYASR